MIISETETLLVCDDCGEEEEFLSFEEALNFKRDKDNGWRSAKEDGVWCDFCPSCVALFNRTSDN